MVSLRLFHTQKQDSIAKETMKVTSMSNRKWRMDQECIIQCQLINTMLLKLLQHYIHSINNRNWVTLLSLNQVLNWINFNTAQILLRDTLSLMVLHQPFHILRKDSTATEVMLLLKSRVNQEMLLKVLKKLNLKFHNQLHQVQKVNHQRKKMAIKLLKKNLKVKIQPPKLHQLLQKKKQNYGTGVLHPIPIQDFLILL